MTIIKITTRNYKTVLYTRSTTIAERVLWLSAGVGVNASQREQESLDSINNTTVSLIWSGQGKCNFLGLLIYMCTSVRWAIAGPNRDDDFLRCRPLCANAGLLLVGLRIQLVAGKPSSLIR